MRSIPVDLILHETALKLRELPEEHHRGLAGDIRATCIFPYGVAEQWANGAGVCQSAAWIVRRLDPASGGPVFPVHISAETRAMEVAVSRRLADCALSLLVTQDPEDTTAAQTLLQAAQRVVGLAPAKPSAEEARPASATDSPEDGRDAWFLWIAKLAGQGHEQSSSKALREALSARLIDPKGQRLKVARNCLPSNVDIIVCMRGNDPATYKAANTDEEYDTPEAAARAAWEHHQRPVQSVPTRVFKVGDRVRFVRRVGEESQHKDAPPIGWEGVIDEDDKSELPLRVVGAPVDNDGAHAWWFISEELDLITPTA